jgi:hypothetical protein
MSERTEKFQADVDREYQKAARAHAKAAAGSMALLQDNLVIALFFGVFLLGMAVILILGLEEMRTSNAEYYAARDKALLECRLTGGAYEYFGTQGYVCIPDPRARDSRQ